MKYSKVLLAVLGLSLMASLLSCSPQKANAEEANNEGKTKTEHKSGQVKHINAKYMRDHIYDYKENPTKFVFKGERPAVLDFYADWCGPCRDLSPKISKLAKKYKGQIDFYKIDTDKEEELSEVFGLHSIPMLLFIPMEGTPISTVGNLTMEQLEESLAKIKVKK